LKVGIVKVNGKKTLVFYWKGHLVDVFEFADPRSLIYLLLTLKN